MKKGKTKEIMMQEILEREKMEKVIKPTLKEMLDHGLGAIKYLEKIERGRKYPVKVRPSKKILTIEEIGPVLGMRVGEVYNGIKSGTIPFLRSGKGLAFDKRAVLEALNIKQMNDEKGEGTK